MIAWFLRCNSPFLFSFIFQRVHGCACSAPQWAHSLVSGIHRSLPICMAWEKAQVRIGFVLLFFYLAKHNYINVTQTSLSFFAALSGTNNRWRHMAEGCFCFILFFFVLFILFGCCHPRRRHCCSLCAMQCLYTRKVEKCWTSPHIRWMPNCHTHIRATQTDTQIRTRANKRACAHSHPSEMGKDVKCSASTSEMKCEKNMYRWRLRRRRGGGTTEHQMLEISNINANIEFFCVVLLFLYYLFLLLPKEVILFSFEPNARKMPGMFAFWCIFGLLTKAAAAATAKYVRVNSLIKKEFFINAWGRRESLMCTFCPHA